MSFSGKEALNLLRKGYFAVNKPKNWTSKEVLEELKKVLREDVPTIYQPSILKLGHGGILDQTATGVLAVGIGWGCKILPLLLKGDKKYIATGCFGIATDTYNEVGKVTQNMRYDHITEQMFENALQKYMGNIYQTPPKYSALKRDGRTIADWTREGIDIQMTPRPVVCYNIQSIEFSVPHFKIEVSCGGGFYIRSLIHDIGQDLSSCAHVTALHRTKHGPFSEEDMLDQSQWKGSNITKAIFEAREKYSHVLRRNVKKKRKTVQSSKCNLFPYLSTVQ